MCSFTRNKNTAWTCWRQQVWKDDCQIQNSAYNPTEKTALWLSFVASTKTYRFGACFFSFTTKRNRTMLAICRDSIAKRWILSFKKSKIEIKNCAMAQFCRRRQNISLWRLFFCKLWKNKYIFYFLQLIYLFLLKKFFLSWFTAWKMLFFVC